MKKLVIAGALSVLLAAPAFAQSPYGPYGPYASYGPYGAYDPYGGYGWPVVIADGGRIVGVDPDPNVRLDLLRTAQGSDIYNY